MRMGWTDPKVLKRVIEEMTRYRLKVLVIELNEGLEYRSHPEISAPWAMSQGTMREIVHFARGFFGGIVWADGMHTGCHDVLNFHGNTP